MTATYAERPANAMEIYMREVGRCRLLSAQEERKLAALYQKGRTAKRLIQERVPLDIQRRANLATALARGERARLQLVEGNLRLVITLVREYRGCGLPLGDLVQEGNIGLLEAVERYDHRKGIRFATYAGWWIKKNVRQALTNHGRVIRLPTWVLDNVARLRRTRAP